MRSVPQLSGYSAGMQGVPGLAQCMANELGEYGIQVNSVHPETTDTPALDAMSALMGRTREDNMGYYTASRIFKNPIDPGDISRAVLFPASDDARNISAIAPSGGRWLVGACLTQAPTPSSDRPRADGPPLAEDRATALSV